MAFNRSNFTSKNLSTARSNAAEGKVTYGGTPSGHRWFKLLPGLTEFKKPKEPCKMAVNIIPFMRKDGTCDWIYNRFVHSIPRTDGGYGTNDFICTHNDPCDRMKEDIEAQAVENGMERAEWADIKMYVPKSQSLYLMNPVGTDELMVFTCPTKISATVKSFPEKLNGQAVACAGDESIIDYASLDSGKSVVLVWGEASYKNHKYMDITGIAFKDRTEEISDVVLEKVPDYIEMIDNLGANDNDLMETLINGGEISQKETEEQKQDAFEKSCEESIKPSAMDAFKMDEGPLSEDDFKVNGNTKFAEVANPAPKMGLVCPNGFDIKTEYGCHRQCMRCPLADQCEKVAG